MVVLSLLAGLLLLLGGGEALVRGSVDVAVRLRVSPLIIGLTLVGFGTSVPELVASLDAALRGSPGIAVGNVVGSNIANILLILGASAAIRPLVVGRRSLVKDGSIMIAASLVLIAVAFFGTLSRPVGALLVGCVVAYTLISFFTDRRDPRSREEPAEADGLIGGRSLALPAALLLAVAGIAGVVWGASLLVDAAVEIARTAGLSEAVIGLTLVAVGTSLPELVTSVMAAIRRQGDIAIGNVLGSNIFNILGIAGTTALVVPIPIPAEILDFDVWIMLASAALFVGGGLLLGRFGRLAGFLSLACYAAYLGVLIAL